MGGLVIVEGDPVRGTDTHNVSGVGPNPAAPPPTLPYSGTGDFEYRGAVTAELSDFVRIGNVPVALVTSRSSLDAGETSPTGKHAGPNGGNFKPGPASQTTTPTPASLKIDDSPLGTGTPNSAAGSALLTVDKVKVLLHGDKIDTCSGVGGLAGSTVAAQGQDFVSCSA